MTSSRTEQKEDPITVDEITAIAKRKLPTNVYDYYACGSDEQQAVDRNIHRLLVLPRALIDVTSVDSSTHLFGTRYELPIGFAPSAMQKLAGGNGELDVAAAARNLNLNMTLSSQSTCSLEDVMQTVGRERATPDLWMQIYLTRDPEKSIPLIKRAEDAGYKALVVTCDTPVLGNRLNERKTPLVLPKGLRLANINPAPADDDDDKKERKPTFNRLLMDARTAADARHIVDSAGPSMHSSSLTWEKTLPWLRKATPMKVILKGIMTPEDALLAVEHGADAIIVSNHGGRQLDDSPATIEVLQGIAEAVAGRIPVIFDGGVRRGSDVFKALALGANFVLIGRPVLWGLAYKGREGVEAVANILERELNRTMALAGVTKVKDIKKSSLAVARTDTFGLARL